MSDISFLKQLKNERQKRERFLTNQKLSLVCEHVLIYASPSKPVPIVMSTVEHPHPKHDGQVVLCPNCDKLFELESGLNMLSGKIYLAPENKFKYNISDSIKGLSIK